MTVIVNMHDSNNQNRVQRTHLINTSVTSYLIGILYLLSNFRKYIFLNSIHNVKSNKHYKDIFFGGVKLNKQTCFFEPFTLKNQRQNDWIIFDTRRANPSYILSMASVQS